MVDNDMRQVARWIIEALAQRDNETELAALKKKVNAFARQFPIYAW
jgi:glycine hydroxymethyltransferase